MWKFKTQHLGRWEIPLIPSLTFDGLCAAVFHVVCWTSNLIKMIRCHVYLTTSPKPKGTSKCWAEKWLKLLALISYIVVTVWNHQEHLWAVPRWWKRVQYQTNTGRGCTGEVVGVMDCRSTPGGSISPNRYVPQPWTPSICFFFLILQSLKGKIHHTHNQLLRPR